jgi:hypothetical protein
MKHPIHDPVVDIIHQAVKLMDAFMRNKFTLEAYAEKLRAFNVNDLMAAYQEDFKKDASLVYYLDALMLLSSLQHELEYQVAEYGANVASEDIRNLEELLGKIDPSSASAKPAYPHHLKELMEMK